MVVYVGDEGEGRNVKTSGRLFNEIEPIYFPGLVLEVGFPCR